MKNKLEEVLDNYIHCLPGPYFSPQEHVTICKIAYVCHVENLRINDYESRFMEQLDKKFSLSKEVRNTFWEEFLDHIDENQIVIERLDRLGLLKKG